MGNELNFNQLVWHSTKRLVFSIRGLIALLFSIFMVSMVAYVFDRLPAAFFEIIRLFTTEPNMQLQWLLFDNSLSKLLTLFIAPMLIFDAVSGDRANDGFGLILSRPITRTQYLLAKLLSATLAFGIIFLPTMAIGYPVYQGIVNTVTAASYFGTCVLMFMLAFFTMCAGLLVSILTKRVFISFISLFGLMMILMLPNSMKYTSQQISDLSMATPHYYATYFTSHPFDATLCAGYAVLILCFSIPFLLVSFWKFDRDDL